MRSAITFCSVILLLVAAFVPVSAAQQPQSLYESWSHGPSTDPDHFPIGVWLQSPSNAAKYKAAGINMYVGLWQGPTEAQLSTLTEAGMQVLCDQNAVGLAHIDDPIIIGWTQQDEPDNAQSDGAGGYGPPVLPEVIQGIYTEFATNDPSRPVFLNLGQGVSYTDYIGRGSRRGHTEDYPEYIKGCDIVSFDIYPVTSPYDNIKGKLNYVSYGVKNLIRWSEGAKPVWNFIECTHISSTEKPTPAQVRAEVWSSIICGSRGIMYFVHQFQPSFNEDALLDDAEMLAAVTTINGWIKDTAWLLNSENDSTLTVKPSSSITPVDAMVKRDWRQGDNGDYYVFAVNKYNKNLSLKVSSPEGVNLNGVWRELTEDRIVSWENGFEEEFAPFDFRIYKLDMSSVGVDDKTPDTGLKLMGNSPNPFNPTTSISFRLAEARDGSVFIYDVGGRKIRTLFEGHIQPGVTSLVWDGLDSGGIKSSSGIYFYEVKAGAERQTGRMLLLR